MDVPSSRMGTDDSGNTVGNLRFMHTAVRHNSVRRVDMGLAQGSAHQFDANRSDRRTCCRRARSGRLRFSLPRRFSAVYCDMVRRDGYALCVDRRATRAVASPLVIIPSGLPKDGRITSAPTLGSAAI